MSTNNTVHTCNFCGTRYTEEYLVKNNLSIIPSLVDKNIKICENCVNKCVNAISSYRKTEEDAKKETKDLAIKNKHDIEKPSEISTSLSQWIIGQDKAKKDISTGVYNHYKLIASKDRKDINVELEKSNILLIGPTGTGKTAIVKALGKKLKVPYTIVDANSFTQAGYVGRNVEDMLKDLLDAADGDLELAQRGIIYIDEIDKISRKGSTPSAQRDVSGEGVQQALLKLVEGGIFEISSGPKRQMPILGEQSMKFDTSNVLFIGGGSFEGIEKNIQKRLNQKLGKTNVGFGGKLKATEIEENFNQLIVQVTPEDLRTYGMLPELLGRFPIVTSLTQLDEETMINILTEPKNALYKQYKSLLKMDDIDLEITDDALEEIAKKALEKKIGARSLRSTMEEVLKDVMYIAPDIKGLKAIKITKEAVNDSSCTKYLIEGNTDELNLEEAKARE